MSVSCRLEKSELAVPPPMRSPGLSVQSTMVAVAIVVIVALA